MIDITPTIVEIPREAAHFIAEYDSSDNILRLMLVTNAKRPSEFVKAGMYVTNGTTIPSDLHGMLVATTDIGVIGRYEINAQTGAIVDQQADDDVALWWSCTIHIQRKSSSRIRKLTMVAFIWSIR